MTELNAKSETDASNTDISGANVAENCPMSGLNDAIRGLTGMAKRAYDRDHAGAWVTVGGTANAITLTYSVGPAAYVTGEKFTFAATASNTGATTVNVSGLGAKNVFTRKGAAPAACVGGEIQTGAIVELEYDGTQFQIVAGDSFGQTTWTPTDASGAGLTFSSVTGHYVQIGNMVFAYAVFTYPATADGSNAKINLPVAAATPHGTIATFAGIANVAVRTLSGTSTADFRTISTNVNVTNATLTGSTIAMMAIYPAT